MKILVSLSLSLSLSLDLICMSFKRKCLKSILKSNKFYLISILLWNVRNEFQTVSVPFILKAFFLNKFCEKKIQTNSWNCIKCKENWKMKAKEVKEKNFRSKEETKQMRKIFELLLKFSEKGWNKFENNFLALIQNIHRLSKTCPLMPWNKWQIIPFCRRVWEIRFRPKGNGIRELFHNLNNENKTNVKSNVWHKS